MDARIDQVVVPQWLDRPPLEALEVARTADELGYRELWIGELQQFDAFALAGALARDTAGVTLCVGPLAAAVRDPVSLARGVASVAALGGRPARLALGASNATVVERFHGRRFVDQPGLMVETADVVRTVLAGGRTDVTGEHVSSRGYRSSLGPQRVHLSVAAFGPQMLEVAGRIGDRAVLNVVTVGQAERLAASVSTAARRGGRDPIPVTVWVVAAIDPGEATRTQVAGQIARYLAAPGYSGMFTDAGFGDLVERARARVPIPELAAAVPSELFDAVAAIGPAAEVWRRLGEYRDAGVEPAVVPATAEDPGAERLLRVLADG